MALRKTEKKSVRSRRRQERSRRRAEEVRKKKGMQHSVMHLLIKEREEGDVKTRR